MSQLPPLKRGPWRLADLARVPKINKTVFSCFHCAGGSSMGYKLAGYDVLGGVEIDKAMMEVYRKNHHPEHSYLESIVEFNKRPRESLPPELLNLDILDGSPPCSSFSTAGARQKHWGVLKVFREGQAAQVLDDLFGHFLQTVALLRPKVVIAENVRGMLLGHAKGYVKEICETFAFLGYKVQVFQLNGATMGIPQSRRRVFFVANRMDKSIQLDFNEPKISAGEALRGVRVDNPKMGSPLFQRGWRSAEVGKQFGTSRSQAKAVVQRIDPTLPVQTMTATENLAHWSEPRYMQGLELVRIQSFPDDFDFCGKKQHYVCGMSVPPLMMQRVAREVAIQLLGIQ